MGCLDVTVSRVGGDLRAVISPVCGVNIDKTIVGLQDAEGVQLYSSDDRKLLAKQI